MRKRNVVIRQRRSHKNTIFARDRRGVKEELRHRYRRAELINLRRLATKELGEWFGAKFDDALFKSLMNPTLVKYVPVK
jgi:hypothetical protein